MAVFANVFVPANALRTMALVVIPVKRVTVEGHPDRKNLGDDQNLSAYEVGNIETCGHARRARI